VEALLIPDTANTTVVYIVDQDECVRKSLSRLMHSAGLRSQEFSSADEFLAQLDEGQKGCILLDITMPHPTCLQLQVELKQRGIDMPIITVSANDDAKTRNLALKLGAQFFFRKPVDDKALIDTIQWMLATHRQESP
jgi:FixJ family two-component response regulator